MYKEILPMKIKKVLSLALAFVSLTLLASCGGSSPEPPQNGTIGERITKEEFENVSTMCCDNYSTKSTYVQSLTAIGNYKMGYVEETTTYYCGNLIYSQTVKDVTWEENVVDSETGESTTKTTKYQENYQAYYQKDGENYYSYTYNKTNDVWNKTTDSYGDLHFNSGNSAILGENFSAELSQEFAYFSNFDNWTYLEETGEYQILNFECTVKGYPVSISEKLAYKDGHIVRISVSYDGGKKWTITDYYDHGKNDLTLPTNVVDNTVTE